MPVRVSSSPRSVLGNTTVTWVGDGTIKLSDGRILSQAELGSIKQVLADNKQILILSGEGDADTLFKTGMAGLSTAYDAGDGGSVPGYLRSMLRGVHLKFGISTGAMVAGAAHVTKVPTSDGLVDAGQAAVLVLDKFEGETYNARTQVDPTQLAGQCKTLDLHLNLKGVYDGASEKVQPGIVFLSSEVCAASDIVYGAIEDALPINEDLAGDAGPLVSYFDEPVEKGQATKKLVKKTKDKTTQEVTSSVQAKALDQARTELKGELADKLGSVVDSVTGGNTAST